MIPTEEENKVQPPDYYCYQHSESSRERTPTYGKASPTEAWMDAFTDTFGDQTLKYYASNNPPKKLISKAAKLVKQLYNEYSEPYILFDNLRLIENLWKDCEAELATDFDILLPALLRLTDHPVAAIQKQAICLIDVITQTAIIYRDEAVQFGVLTQLQRIATSAEDNNIREVAGFTLAEILAHHPRLEEETDDLLPLLINILRYLNDPTGALRFCRLLQKLLINNYPRIRKAVDYQLLTVLGQQLLSYNDDTLYGTVTLMMSIQRSMSEELVTKPLMTRFLERWESFLKRRSSIKEAAVLYRFCCIYVQNEMPIMADNTILIAQLLETAETSNYWLSACLLVWMAEVACSAPVEKSAGFIADSGMLKCFVVRIARINSRHDGTVANAAPQVQNHGSINHQCNERCLFVVWSEMLRCLNRLLVVGRDTKTDYQNPVLEELAMLGAKPVLQQAVTNQFVEFKMAAYKILSDFFL